MTTEHKMVTCIFCGKKTRPATAIHITSRTLPELNDKYAHKRCYKKL